MNISNFSRLDRYFAFVNFPFLFSKVNKASNVALSTLVTFLKLAP